jgi:O-antigen/teichoic acid export membrane protein
MVPILVSLITVPLYLREIGLARYGIMSVVWILLGYFGVFDLGLSRATTNQIAKSKDGPAEEREAVFWTGVWLNGLFGLTGGVVLYLAASPLLAQVFKMPEAMRWEILGVLPWVAASVPIATMSGVVTGTLEGCDRFLIVNFLQVFGTILFQVVPLLAVFVWGPELSVIIPAAVFARIISAISLAIAAARALPTNRIRLPQRNWVKKLVGYGAWVSLTSLVSPLLVTLDQMMIGSILGAKAVAYYNVPFNLVQKVQVVPSALVRALFPRLSNQASGDAKELATRAVRLIGISMTLIIAPAILLVGPFLKIWVGADVAGHATPVAQIILLGLWVNSPAFVPFTLLQAQGRPDVVAKFHVLEFVPFVGLLWVALNSFGLIGAALAWSARVTLDTSLLFLGSRIGWASLVELLPGVTLVGVAWFIAAAVQPTPLLAAVIAVGMVLGTTAWGWRIEPEIRRFLNKWYLNYLL